MIKCPGLESKPKPLVQIDNALAIDLPGRHLADTFHPDQLLKIRSRLPFEIVQKNKLEVKELHKTMYRSQRFCGSAPNLDNFSKNVKNYNTFDFFDNQYDWVLKIIQLSH